MFIVPKPQSMSCYSGHCAVNNLKVAADMFDTICKDAEFFGLKICPEEQDTNVFFYTDAAMKNEEYEILADEGGIRITYATPCGRFRALSTLKQLASKAEDGRISCVKIHDFPDIPVRGLMVVVNDKRLYNMDTLRYIVDRLAELKYNSLQLYFDSFVFEYDSLSRYLEGRVYYTKEEIHALDEYCKERHVELVANVETFGHMQALLATEEFKHLAITRDNGVPFTLNPLLEESLDVVKAMVDDLLPHFSSSTVHIGMDETYGIGMNETKGFCDAFGTGRLFTDFLTKVSGHIKDKHSKRSMIWSDMAVKYPECIKDIPKDVIFVDWGYEPGHKFGENALLCKQHGLDFYVAPGTHRWGNFSGRTDIMVQNIYFAAEAARSHGAMGFLLTEWQTLRDITVSMLPYCFGAAFSWNSGYAKTVSEADNESNCFFRNEVINSVLAYFDKYILHCSDTSGAELIYRMGNCWMHEQPDSAATWNGTLLYKEFMGVDKGDYKPLSPQKLKRILRYMLEIKEELETCHIGADNANIMRSEMMLACDLTIYAAATLLQEAGVEMSGLKLPDKDALIALYEKLGQLHLRTAGEHPVITRIKK